MRVVAVLGAGTMGHGIAQACAMAGCEVRLRDVKDEFVAKGLAGIEGTLAKGVAKGKVQPQEKDSAMARIRGTTSLAEAVQGCDLVVEAIPERLDLKRSTFQEVEGLAPQHAVLATNTSSLSIASIAQALRHRERLVGMHFFNPVPASTLVEIIRTPDTDDAVVGRVRGWVELLGKQEVLVNDSPGFATSRLGVCLGLEAIRMLEEGVADAESIDRAMELGYRHPMGPLRSTDLVGLDVRLAIAEHLAVTLGERFAPPQLLRDMVARGDLGRKTGRGFHTWP